MLQSATNYAPTMNCEPAISQRNIRTTKRCLHIRLANAGRLSSKDSERRTDSGESMICITAILLRRL